MRGNLLWTRDAWIIRQAKAPWDRVGTVAPPNGQVGALRPVGAQRCVGMCRGCAGVYPGQLGSCAGLVRPTRREKCIVLCVRGPSWARVTVGAGALVGLGAPKVR